MDDKTLYLCNPKKNAGCRKTGCWWYGRGRCALTDKPESAVEYTDGKPIRVRMKLAVEPEGQKARFRLELVKE